MGVFTSTWLIYLGECILIMYLFFLFIFLCSCIMTIIISSIESEKKAIRIYHGSSHFNIMFGIFFL